MTNGQTNLVPSHVAWCEHGWSWWQLHLWILAMGLLGWYMGLAQWTEYAGWLILPHLLIPTLLNCHLLISLWLTIGLGGWIYQNDPVYWITQVVGAVWLVSNWRPGTLYRRLSFAVSPMHWHLFRVSLGLSLIVIYPFYGFEHAWPYELLKGMLAASLLLVGWIGLLGQNSPEGLERGVVLATLGLALISWVVATPLPLPILLLFIGSWNLRLWPARRLERSRREWIFLDEQCSLCQLIGRVVLVEDKRTTAFFFASCQAPYLQQRVLSDELTGPQLPLLDLPRGLYVVTDENCLLSSVEAALYIFRSLGGIWMWLGCFFECVPLDWNRKLYEGVASYGRRKGPGKTVFFGLGSLYESVPTCLRSRWQNPPVDTPLVMHYQAGGDT